MHINALYSHYLMSSYLYYKNLPVVPWSDVQFDMACKRLLLEWDDIDHIHKHLCSKEDLEAGTGFSIDFPLQTQHAAMHWVESLTKRKD